MYVRVTDPKIELLVKAALDLIENELCRLYWNKHQEEYDSPFQNTGNTYTNQYVTITAFNWDENSDIFNFSTDLIKIRWYKHSHRNLAIYINNEVDSVIAVKDMLFECIKSINDDFDE